jgi:hypothetical protein
VADAVAAVTDAVADDVGASRATTISRTGHPATRYALSAGPEAAVADAVANAADAVGDDVCASRAMTIFRTGHPATRYALAVGPAAGAVEVGATAGEVGVFAKVAASALQGPQPLTISAEIAFNMTNHITGGPPVPPVYQSPHTHSSIHTAGRCSMPARLTPTSRGASYCRPD